MAIATKARRTSVVDGVTYLWWVTQSIEDDFLGSPVLTVSSEDRAVLARYGLGQDNCRYAVVLGPRFQGLPDAPGPWRRFACPAFGRFDSVTPKDVAAFTHWCTDPSGQATQVDYRGQPV
jgi:hypothetical protein